MILIISLPPALAGFHVSKTRGQGPIVLAFAPVIVSRLARQYSDCYPRGSNVNSTCGARGSDDATPLSPCVRGIPQYLRQADRGGEAGQLIPPARVGLPAWRVKLLALLDGSSPTSPSPSSAPMTRASSAATASSTQRSPSAASPATWTPHLERLAQSAAMLELPCRTRRASAARSTPSSPPGTGTPIPRPCCG